MDCGNSPARKPVNNIVLFGCVEVDDVEVVGMASELFKDPQEVHLPWDGPGRWVHGRGTKDYEIWFEISLKN